MSGEFHFKTRSFDTLTGHLVTDADECNYTQEVIAEVLLLICMQECHLDGFLFSFPLKKYSLRDLYALSQLVNHYNRDAME